MLFLFAAVAAGETRYCFGSFLSNCPEGTTRISNMKDFKFSQDPKQLLYLYLANSESNPCTFDWSTLPNSSSLEIDGHKNGFVKFDNIKTDLNLSLSNVRVQIVQSDFLIYNLTISEIEVILPQATQLDATFLLADLRSLTNFSNITVGQGVFDMSLEKLSPDKSFDICVSDFTSNVGGYGLQGPYASCELHLGTEYDTLTIPNKDNVTVRFLKPASSSGRIGLELTTPDQTFLVSYEKGMTTNQCPLLGIQMFHNTSFAVPDLPAYCSTWRFHFQVFGDVRISAGLSSYSCVVETQTSCKVTYVIREESWSIWGVSMSSNSTLELETLVESDIMFVIAYLSFAGFHNAELLCLSQNIELSIEDIVLEGTVDSHFSCNTSRPVRLSNSLVYGNGIAIFERVTVSVLLQIKYRLSLESEGLLQFNYVEKNSYPVDFKISYTDVGVPSDEKSQPFIDNPHPFFVATGYTVDDVRFLVDSDVKVDGFSRAACLLKIYFFTLSYRFGFQLLDYPSRVSPSFCYGNHCSLDIPYLHSLDDTTFDTWKSYVSNYTQNVNVYLNGSMTNNTFDFGGLHFKDANLRVVCLGEYMRCKLRMTMDKRKWKSLSFTATELTITAPDNPVIDVAEFTFSNESYINMETIKKMEFVPEHVRADISSVGNLQSYCKSRLTIFENYLDMLNVTMNALEEWVFSDMVGCYMVITNENYVIEHRAKKLNIKHGEQSQWSPLNVVWNAQSTFESPSEINFEGISKIDGIPKVVIVDSVATDLRINTEDGIVPVIFMQAENNLNVTIVSESDIYWTHPLEFNGKDARIVGVTGSGNKIRFDRVVLRDLLTPVRHTLHLSPENISVTNLEVGPGISNISDGIFDKSIVISPGADLVLSNGSIKSSTMELSFDGESCPLVTTLGTTAKETPTKIIVKGKESSGQDCKLIIIGEPNRCQDYLQVTELENSKVIVNGKEYKAKLHCIDTSFKGMLMLSVSAVSDNQNKKLLVAIVICCSVVILLGIASITIYIVRMRMEKDASDDDSLYTDLIGNEGV